MSRIRCRWRRSHQKERSRVKSLGQFRTIQNRDGTSTTTSSCNNPVLEQQRASVCLENGNRSHGPIEEDRALGQPHQSPPAKRRPQSENFPFGSFVQRSPSLHRQNKLRSRKGVHAPRAHRPRAAHAPCGHRVGYLNRLSRKWSTFEALVSTALLGKELWQGVRAPWGELTCNQCSNTMKDDKLLHTNPNFACGYTAQVPSAVTGTGKSIGRQQHVNS